MSGSLIFAELFNNAGMISDAKKDAINRKRDAYNRELKAKKPRKDILAKLREEIGIDFENADGKKVYEVI